MSDELILGLIALVGAVAGPVFGYVIARQSATDRRTNIARDLETLHQLDPASETATMLSNHIKRNVAAVVLRDESRDEQTQLVWKYLRIVGAGGLFYGAAKWSHSNPPQDIESGLVVFEYGILALLLYFVGNFAWAGIRLILLLTRRGRNHLKLGIKAHRIVSQHKVIRKKVIEAQTFLATMETDPAARAAEAQTLGGEDALQIKIDANRQALNNGLQVLANSEITAQQTHND